MVMRPSELAQLRAELMALLPEQVTQYRAVRQADGAGGWTTTLQVLGTLRARFANLTARLQELAQALQVAATGVVVLPATADLQVGDVLERAGGQRWRVEAVLPAPSEHLVRRAFIVEV